MLKFVEAVLILVGMIIGVGMFAIPFSFTQAGFWLGALELLILAVVVVLLHLLYAEVVLATPELHRMPGYVRVYLGARAAILSRASSIFGILGTLLAYVLLGAVFLHGIFRYIFPNSSEALWAVALVAIGALITYSPLRRAAFINGILTALLVFFTILLIAFLLPRVELSHIRGFELSQMFIPYGVLLFALTGGTVIPDVITLLGRRRKKARQAIVIGTLLPAAVYFFFAFAVVGVSGNEVTENAIQGLLPAAGGFIVFWGNMIGFLAVITSYIVLNKSFQQMLMLDFMFSKVAAWGAGIFSPFLLYIAGFTSFIALIGTVGSIALGIDAGLLIAMYMSLHAKGEGRRIWYSQVWKVGIIYAVILAAICYHLYHLLPI